MSPPDGADAGGGSAPRTLRNAADLAAAGLVAPERIAALAAVADAYAVAITPAMAELIDPRDPRDPIARQFVPREAELARTAEEIDDPIGDLAHGKVKGIVHRYPDRVLLKPAMPARSIAASASGARRSGRAARR